MKGEAQLINLMHHRYMEALRDFIVMLEGDRTTIERHVDLANKLSTINAKHYKNVWDKSPSPQKFLELSTEGDIQLTTKYQKQHG